jgi:putative SOS response-associated peptidase YedK
MCYSAQIQADHERFLRRYGAVLSLRDFVKIYWERNDNPKLKLPRALDAMLVGAPGDELRELRALVEQFNAAESTRLEQALFKQRRRLADAQRALATRATQAAAESQRIAADKIDRALERLASLRRPVPDVEDGRIFPGWFAPVMVMEQGRRVIKPMRYQCRPAGKPASYDARYPGTYNARRDNLEGFWKNLFGRTHALMLTRRFYENVRRDARNVVLEFEPRTGEDMLVACLWSRWVGPDGEALLSFAAITDEPPPEIAAAGHDRCIVPIKAENIDAWLNPDPTDLAASRAILEDRARPYYEHRLAA